MKRCLTIALLMLFVLPTMTFGMSKHMTPQPRLLVSNDYYSIHAFHGMIGEDLFLKPVKPGVVLMHTNASNKRARWMLWTGTFEVTISKEKKNYTHSRLVGVHQTESHLYTVVYTATNIETIDDIAKLPADKGHYSIYAMDKKTGRSFLRSRQKLHPKTQRPEKIPAETYSPGVIVKTDAGFTILGCDYTIKGDGSLAFVLDDARQARAEEAKR